VANYRQPDAIIHSISNHAPLGFVGEYGMVHEPRRLSCTPATSAGPAQASSADDIAMANRYKRSEKWLKAAFYSGFEQNIMA